MRNHAVEVLKKEEKSWSGGLKNIIGRRRLCSLNQIKQAIVVFKGKGSPTGDGKGGWG